MIPKIDDLKHFLFRHPVDKRISQKFGENKVDFYAKLGMKGHNGIDYACPEETLIYTPCMLEITNFYEENVDKGYGTTVWARSEPFDFQGQIYRVEMVFAHLSQYFGIHRGLWLNQGEPIAYSGNTGKYTTGPHLHWGCRLIKKSFFGWKATETDNGYKGYFNQLPITSWEQNLAPYEGNVVKGAGNRHYLVEDKKLLWIEDEVAFATGGFLFEESEQIDPNLVNQTQGEIYDIDYDSHKTKEVKQLVGLLKDKSDRATKLYSKYF